MGDTVRILTAIMLLSIGAGCTPFYASLFSDNSGESETNALLLTVLTSDRSSGNSDPSIQLRLFLTARQPDGDLQSSSEPACALITDSAQRADCYCSNDPMNPDPLATFKAMIVGGNRIATTGTCSKSSCPGQQDWVLHPLALYRSLSGERIFLTDATSLFDPGNGILNPLTFQGNGGASTEFWSGLSTNWSNAGNNCNGWTDGTPSGRGTVGRSTFADERFLSFDSNVACENVHGPGGSKVSRLLCVEQAL